MIMRDYKQKPDHAYEKWSLEWLLDRAALVGIATFFVLFLKSIGPDVYANLAAKIMGMFA